MDNPTDVTQAQSSLAQAIGAQFASRPTLEAVTRQRLADSIAEKYPPLEIDLALTQLATPHADGGSYLRPLMALVLEYLANGTEPDFRDRHGRACYLSDAPPTRLRLPDQKGSPVDLKLIATLIKELPSILPASLQNQLAMYWSENTDTGVSRWRWLSDRLMDALRINAIKQPGLDDADREALNQLVDCPDSEARKHLLGEHAVHVYCPEIVFTHGNLTNQQLGPELLLVYSSNGSARVLLCKPSGIYERFKSVQDFNQEWGKRIASGFDVEKITVNRYEPDGNIFDTQASILLNQQLEDLQALRLPANQGLDTLLGVYREITDPGLYFLNSRRASPPVPITLHNGLPEWLQKASTADRMTYRQYSLMLASAKKRSNGRTFLSAIADIYTFTNAALLKQLTLDEISFDNVTPEQSKAGRFQPEDLQLTFAVAVGYPGGAGFVERVPMSLTDLAIKNLVARPRGELTLKHRDGLPLPVWLTADYIQRSGGLIEQVDIGKSYPQMLKAQLLGDSPQVSQREVSFAGQTLAQLPLLALELKLTGQNGLTEQGVRYVCALMSENSQERFVDDQSVVIRVLALVRKPEANPDVVTNMFIIEAHNPEVGPHILYRPLYSQPLLEFATHQQLLDALAQPGDLQASVLTWLSDAARPVYANGGFLEPHYVRFGLGSEFAPIDTPQPATLAKDGASDELLLSLSSGKLMQYLYGSNARALVDQADRDSVSNSESRWAVLMEGAGQLFNTLLLPFLRGPAMMTGWLLSLMSSASRDIPALNSQDPVTRELALVDLLLNVGMLLLQLPSSASSLPARLGQDIRRQALQSPVPERIAGQWPEPPPANIHEGIVALDSEGAGSDHSVFDFSFSNPRTQLTASQRARLALLHVPQPVPLPKPVLAGAYKGLYRHSGNWYAQVGALWYRVAITTDEFAGLSVVIASASAPHAFGPALKSDGQGNWSLDLKLRLRGGMPRERIAAIRRRKAERKAQLRDEYERLFVDDAAVQKKVDDAERVMNMAAADPKYNEAVRANTRRAYDNALKSQAEGYTGVLDTLKERLELEIPVRPEKVAILMENTIKNARKSVVVADMDRVMLYATHKEFVILNKNFARQVMTQMDRYKQFIKQVVEINERQMHWLELKDRYLTELFDLGEPGAEAFDRLTRDRPEEVTALGVKHLQMLSLKFSTVKDWTSFPFDEFTELFEPLQTQVRTHSQLKLFELTPKERLEVLESLSDRYGHALDAMEGLGIVHADAIETEAFNRLRKLLDELYQDVTQQLAGEIKPPAKKRKRPPKRPMVSVGGSQKKVIKTRRQGILIGDLKPAGTDLPIDVVEIRSETDNGLLGTYSYHEDAWDEVREVRQPERPEAAPETRALNIVKGEARKQLKKLQEVLDREQRYAKVSRYPVEIQENLQREATRYSNFASELGRAIQAQPEDSRLPADQLLLDELTAAARTLTSKGQELRIQQSMALPPTHANLAYLLQEQRVQVARLGERIAMSGERNDFVQEYAINDRQGTALWYAHFHYAKADSPKPDYTVAHMKPRSQRKENYYSMLAKAQNAQGVVDVHRGAIGKDLAERHFLPLAP